MMEMEVEVPGRSGPKDRERQVCVVCDDQVQQSLPRNGGLSRKRGAGSVFSLSMDVDGDYDDDVVVGGVRPKKKVLL